MRTAVAVLCLMVVALSAFGADAGLKIGYADLTRVLDQYERRFDLEAKLKNIQATLSDQDRSRIQAISKIEQEMGQLAMGSPERLDMDQKYRESIAETEQFRRQSHEKLNQEYVTMLQCLFQDVLAEVDVLAKERDLDFVIKDQSSDEQPLTRPEVILQLSQRVVLYAKPEYDLSEEIIKRLNEKYVTEDEKKAQDAQTTDATP
jgi:Skp family chaperone for outer membrane proteins